MKLQDLDLVKFQSHVRQHFLDSALCQFEWSNTENLYIAIQLDKCVDGVFESVKHFQENSTQDLVVTFNHITVVYDECDREGMIAVGDFNSHKSFMNQDHFESNSDNFNQLITEQDLLHTLIKQVLYNLDMCFNRCSQEFKTVALHFIKHMDDEAVKPNFRKE